LKARSDSELPILAKSMRDNAEPSREQPRKDKDEPTWM